MVRGKFTVTSHKKFMWYPQQTEVVLTAEYDSSIPEDVAYAKATPSGTITMLIDNPPAVEQFALGKKFYVDFTEVPEAPK